MIKIKQIVDSTKQIEVKLKLNELEASWILSALHDKRNDWNDTYSVREGEAKDGAKKMVVNLTTLIEKATNMQKEVFQKSIVDVEK